MAGWRSTQANWAEGRRVGSELQCTTVHYITVLYSTMLVLSFLRPSQKTFLLNFSDFSDFFYTCNLLCCTVKYRTVLNSRHWAVVLYRTITFGHEWGRILNGFKDVLVFLNFTEGWELSTYDWHDGCTVHIVRFRMQMSRVRYEVCSVQGEVKHVFKYFTTCNLGLIK